jgi:hypothetical protein
MKRAAVTEKNLVNMLLVHLRLFNSQVPSFFVFDTIKGGRSKSQEQRWGCGGIPGDSKGRNSEE